MAFARHRRVQLDPLLLGAADRGRVDLAEHLRHVARLQPFEVIVRTGEVSIAFHGHPIPARPKHHSHAWPHPQVVQLPRVPASDETDNGFAGHGVVEHACVHHRSLSRAVGPTGDHDRQTALRGAQLSCAVESQHVSS